MGNRKGHSEAQTVEEMLIEMEKSKGEGLNIRKGQSIYKEKSGEYQEEKLKQLISCNLSGVAEFATKERVALEDLEEIQKRTIIYLRACEESGTFPSSLGLARSLGYSDRALRHWRSKQAHTPTAQWLEMFNELCADILSQSALKNNCNSLMSMFLNKSLYGFIEAEKLIVTTQPYEPEEEEVYDAEDIRSRYVIE